MLAIGAVAAGVYMGVSAQGGHHHGTAAHASLADTITAPVSGGQHTVAPHHYHAKPGRPAAPAGGGTRQAWAEDVLRAAGLPVTDPNVRAMVTWTYAEMGGFGNQAVNNPLNLNPGTAPWPGRPADGAWAFPEGPAGWDDGVRETAAYLAMSNFAGIRAALQRGDSEHAVIVAIVRSPWTGNHHYAGNQVMQDALRDT